MPDDTTASLARRSYHSLLHPLQMRQGGEGEYARTRMSIRINDGEPFDSGFPALPAALVVCHQPIDRLASACGPPGRVGGARSGPAMRPCSCSGSAARRASIGRAAVWVTGVAPQARQFLRC